MKITKRERDGVIILEVEGKVTIGKGDVVLRETVHDAIGDKAVKMLINHFGEIESMQLVLVQNPSW